MIMEAGLGSVAACMALIPFPRWFLVASMASMVFLSTLVHQEVCCTKWAQ